MSNYPNWSCSQIEHFYIESLSWCRKFRIKQKLKNFFPDWLVRFLYLTFEICNNKKNSSTALLFVFSKFLTHNLSASRFLFCDKKIRNDKKCSRWKRICVCAQCRLKIKKSMPDSFSKNIKKKKQKKHTKTY